MATLLPEGQSRGTSILNSIRTITHPGLAGFACAELLYNISLAFRRSFRSREGGQHSGVWTTIKGSSPKIRSRELCFHASYHISRAAHHFLASGSAPTSQLLRKHTQTRKQHTVTIHIAIILQALGRGKGWLWALLIHFTFA
jgi:hypothetical protein